MNDRLKPNLLITNTIGQQAEQGCNNTQCLTLYIRQERK